MGDLTIIVHHTEALLGSLALVCGVLLAAMATTTLPIIGVPVASSELKGVDALYAIAQMPPGVPVACMAIGDWGARNAALFAAQILAVKYDKIREAYDAYRKRQAEG